MMALALVRVLALVMVHIYFALRPGKLWMTRSMIAGWITRADHVSHHDPARWSVDEGGRE